MVYIDVTTGGEASRELLISGLRLFLWDPRIGPVQRCVNLSEGTKILRIKVEDADYADALAFRIASVLIDEYSCFVHPTSDLWIPDAESPHGYHEFQIEPMAGLQ